MFNNRNFCFGKQLSLLKNSHRSQNVCYMQLPSCFYVLGQKQDHFKVTSQKNAVWHRQQYEIELQNNNLSHWESKWKQWPIVVQYVWELYSHH